MIWQLLPFISAPMSFQMAFDGVLFGKHLGNSRRGTVLRFYLSSGPWITAGFSFRSGDDLERSPLVKNHPAVPVARRITGGGCVLHGGDLVFTLIAPAAGRLETVKESYRDIHEAVREAFAGLGVDPRFYEETEDLPKGNDCFSYPVARDLAWKGRKIAGGAQKRSGGVLLHHESLTLLPGVSASDLARGIRRGFEHVFGVRIREAEMDADIFFRAEKIARNARLADGPVAPVREAVQPMTGAG
ncbi:MAG TPA: hypothetical protein PK997_02205 [Candidatus Omnitrophota bacterium]|jgi:lipoate-protein ligase A|nr:hypothetical protein [Candidatus Omnitrophota bacterium]